MKIKKTGKQRPAVYCKICKTSYLDFCMEHCSIPGSWEIRKDIIKAAVKDKR